VNRFVPVAIGGVLAVIAATLRHFYALMLHKERVEGWDEYRVKYTRHESGTRRLRVCGKGWVRVGVYNVESEPLSPNSFPVTMPENVNFEADDGSLYVIRRGSYLRAETIRGMRDVVASNTTRAIEVEAGTTMNVLAQWPVSARSVAPGEPIPLEPVPMHPKASPRIYFSSDDPEAFFKRVLVNYNRSQMPKPWGVMIWVIFTCLVALGVGLLPGAAATLAGVMTWCIALAIGEGSLWHSILTRAE
jgi:hypothetical protein